MSWTDERVQLLSRLWLEGRSASQIATTLAGGLTRNAVIGKVHRLGLAGRVKAGGSAPAAAQDDEVAFDKSSEAMTAAPRRAAARSSAAAASVSAAALPPRAVHGNTALLIAEAPQQEAQTARAPEDVVVPLSLKVTIVDLRESMCRWPIGDPSSSEFRYCGSPTHTGTPYCQYHGKLAYQPAQDRRRERDRRPLLTARSS